MLRERVAQRFADARVDYVSFPSPRRPQTFFLTPRVDPQMGARSPLPVDEAFFDPYTGRFISRAASGNVLSTWIRVLHTGHIGGLPYRLMLVVVGLLVGVLSASGVMIWSRRWKKSRGAR